MNHTATYSPEDNKLCLYPAHRLDADEYARVKEAGCKWAPKQELFVAPIWTPSREDLLLEMCDGEIGDENTSLVERAAERADRFRDYSHNRAKDAETAKKNGRCHRRQHPPRAAYSGRPSFGETCPQGDSVR